MKRFVTFFMVMTIAIFGCGNTAFASETIAVDEEFVDEMHYDLNNDNLITVMDLLVIKRNLFNEQNFTLLDYMYLKNKLTKNTADTTEVKVNLIDVTNQVPDAELIKNLEEISTGYYAGAKVSEGTYYLSFIKNCTNNIVKVNATVSPIKLLFSEKENDKVIFFGYTKDAFTVSDCYLSTPYLMYDLSEGKVPEAISDLVDCKEDSDCTIEIKDSTVYCKNEWRYEIEFEFSPIVNAYPEEISATPDYLVNFNVGDDEYFVYEVMDSYILVKKITK